MQLKEPIVFVQSASAEQLWEPSAHSSMSIKLMEDNRPLNKSCIYTLYFFPVRNPEKSRALIGCCPVQFSTIRTAHPDRHVSITILSRFCSQIGPVGKYTWTLGGNCQRRILRNIQNCQPHPSVLNLKCNHSNESPWSAFKF